MPLCLLDKKMKLLYLEWEDAIANSQWNDDREIEDFAKEVAIIKQVGWVYREDEKYIILVGRIDVRGGENNCYGNLQKIPKTWIRVKKIIKI